MPRPISKLLNGERAWYLEDVERACSTLGFDPVDFLAGLEVQTAFRLAAHDPGTDPGTEIEDDQP